MSEVLTVWLPILILVLMSGLFSGLTLGLLSLDIKQLEIVISAGEDHEKKYAARILPTRRHGNWLLCTLLLGNVAVNALLSILLADMTSGLMGFLLSTALIVIFGEIMPQATCSRYGLAIGYYTVPIVWVIMAMLSPIAWPISLVLDRALGAEMGQIYTRSMFKSLIKQHADEQTADFDNDETAIMCQVIELQEKLVKDIMTPIDQVFGISSNETLDFEQLAKIMESGHSRIPVYNPVKDKGPYDVIGLLFVKDLVLLNPDDEFKVKDILNYYKHQPVFVDVQSEPPMNCSQLLQHFFDQKSHMVVCQKIEEDPAGLADPTYVNIGLVTLEDVVAQLLGKHEPEEEAAGVTPSHTVKGKQQRQFIDMFRRKKAHNSLSPNEITMIYQILIAKVPAFDPSNINKAAVHQMLAGAMIEEMGPEEYLYQKGHVTDSFTLLLEGHLEIVCGQEGFLVEVGPWTPVGSKALSIPEYRPDFTARPRQGAGSPGIKYLSFSVATYEKFMAMEVSGAKAEAPESLITPPDTTRYAGVEGTGLRSRGSSNATLGVTEVELESKQC